MKIEVEISMYPLTKEYIEPIKGFISTLENSEGVSIARGDMSTRLSGESAVLWEALWVAMEGVLEEMRSAFIIKVIKGK